MYLIIVVYYLDYCHENNHINYYKDNFTLMWKSIDNDSFWMIILWVGIIRTEYLEIIANES